ncbi:MAG: two-component system phosphate regulon sensor histidine kinase PhoR [Saprospiraceae bacterium]
MNQVPAIGHVRIAFYNNIEMNKTNVIIGALFLALIALFACQVKWMTDSRNLIEEQFDHKISMAMVYAVNLLGDGKFSPNCSVATATCLPVEEFTGGFQIEKRTGVDVPKVKAALAVALEFYQVKMNYEVEVADKQSVIKESLAQYTCAIDPLQKNSSEYLVVSFPGKDQYVFGKMKFMLFSSIILLSFITLVFVLASYTMIRQRRIHQFNKEFFNNMAHEFRTPLANISLAGTLLSKKTKDPKEEKYLNVLKEESKKLAAQVDRILHLSKIENGEYELAKEELCLKDLIQSVIKDMELQIREKNAVINFNMDSDPTSFIGDRFHLGNAFRNLLENALKYSTINPEINISLKKDREGVLILFQDNGIGIAKKDQKEVFEKYYRVNHGNVHNQKGFGLGLSYVKMIIERHKGFIKIFSDLNKGTRFDLFLPAKLN